MKTSFGICLFEPKIEANFGSLVRSACCFGASFICTIGQRYRRHCSDTVDAAANLPVFHYEGLSDFIKLRPQNYILTAVETCGDKDLIDYCHYKQEIYIFGGEDRTLSEEIFSFCSNTVKINTKLCLNLAIAGSIIMYDRTTKIHENRF